MRKFLLATAAAAAVIATPAAARDGSGYFGVEGGVWLPKDTHGDVFADYTVFQTPNPSLSVPVVPAGPADTQFNNFFGVNYDTGIDLDAVAGYDFGMFRLEGEFGYKRVNSGNLNVNSADLAALNAGLNRPGLPTDPCATRLDPVTGLPAPNCLPLLTAGDLDRSTNLRVLSAMANVLADFGGNGSWGAYVGGGFGRAFVRGFQDEDSAWAYQLIAGVRTAITSNIDIGLKYRYFRTGSIHLTPSNIGFNGNNQRFVLPRPDTGALRNVDRVTAVVLNSDFDQRVQSHSLLASLIFNFGAPPAPPPPPPPPPAPVPVAPATQTCPDGSVIPATSACPAPPPPPPPAPVERGERGQ